MFQNSEILLSINFSSGICQIKENRIAQWGEEIFPEIKAIFQGKTPSYVSPNLDGRPTDVDGEVKDDQVAEEVEKKREEVNAFYKLFASPKFAHIFSSLKTRRRWVL